MKDENHLQEGIEHISGALSFVNLLFNHSHYGKYFFFVLVTQRVILIPPFWHFSYSYGIGHWYEERKFELAYYIGFMIEYTYQTRENPLIVEVTAKYIGLIMPRLIDISGRSRAAAAWCSNTSPFRLQLPYHILSYLLLTLYPHHSNSSEYFRQWSSASEDPLTVGFQSRSSFPCVRYFQGGLSRSFKLSAPRSGMACGLL